MSSRSPSEAFSERTTALFRCSKNSVPVGEFWASASSAQAKLGSSSIAFRKWASESVMRSFSTLSRPWTNSSLAWGEVVEIGIFPSPARASPVAPVAPPASADGTAVSFFAQPETASAEARPIETRRTGERNGRIVSSCDGGAWCSAHRSQYARASPVLPARVKKRTLPESPKKRPWPPLGKLRKRRPDLVLGARGPVDLRQELHPFPLDVLEVDVVARLQLRQRGATLHLRRLVPVKIP